MGKIPGGLVRKPWIVSGYTGVDKLHEKAAHEEMVQYSSQELGSMVEKIADDDAMMAWIDFMLYVWLPVCAFLRL